MKTIGQRIASRREQNNLNQSELARALGLKPQSIQAWESGKSDPRGKRLNEIAKVLHCSPEYLLTGKGDEALINEYEVKIWDDLTPLEDDEIEVPFLKEVELSAGSGRFIIEPTKTKAKLRFGKNTIRSRGIDPKSIVCVTIKGNSMEPFLPDGSTVAIDTGKTNIADGQIYAVAIENELLRIKQLYRLTNNKVRLRSFNRDEYEDEQYSLEDIRVIGKMFWSSVLWD